MKKIIQSIVLSLAVFISFVALSGEVKAATNLPTRIINVVFDDSGSMIETRGEKVDTWCQAKYSMEVFAAMLGENDVMNIYVMSDYDKGKNASLPRLTLVGTDGAAENVAKVHDMVTNAGNTPFNSVRKAYSDIEVAIADEKWLVVLTDGEFQNVDDVDAYFAGKAADVKVMFLGMGEAAESIRAYGDIYFEKAENNKQILEKLTDISTRIFNSDKLEVDVNSKEISFDIPMDELVVFAQGDNVKINGLKSSDGNVINSTSVPVSVRYSEVATSNTNYKDFKIDTGLVGSIVTFKGDFDAGKYMVDVADAETIEVYYKPNVEIMAYLIDEEGQEVVSTEGIEVGEYTLKFGFVRAGTTEKVVESKLLGDVDYTAYMTYNGHTEDKEYLPGDKVTLEEGEYTIDVTANYLKYNTLSTQLNFGVYRNKELVLTIEGNPEYELDREGFLNADEAITVKATLEGTDFTAEQWSNVGLLEIEQSGSKDDRVGFTVEKSEAPGVYNIYPYLIDGETEIGDYDDIDIRLGLETYNGKETWSGETEGPVTITDLRSWFWKNIDKVIKLIVLAAILLILLGYVPGIKKHLPKKLKKTPKINCESNVGMRKTWEVKGRYVKNRATVVLPYLAETGTIRFLPKGVSGVPALKIKAVGSNRMEIVNTKSYIGKKNVTFDGSPVEEKQKKNLRKTAGMRVKYETRDADYTCVLNK